jgi:exopolyphosphatase/guanosine-5'-triphosphate,3'-diphosphate pyrophosphatase
LRLAAIDIGSNSIKLVVVEAAASDSFAVLAREKEPVRLGHGTLNAGHLAPEAIERAADCIKRFASIAEARGAEQIIAIATASVRRARNRAALLTEVRRRTGVQIEVLSGIEEARLIGVAAAQGCVPADTPFLNVDIGGGSTELSLMRAGLPLALYSLKLGAVGLTERMLTSDPVKPKELRALREQVRAALERPARELRAQSWTDVTGTSGTILALGELLRLRAQKGDAHKLQGAQPAGTEITLRKLARLNQELAQLTAAARRSVPGLSAQRAEIIIAGGQILEGVMTALGLVVLRTCDFALREGVIIERLRAWAAEASPPVPDVADPRLRGVHAVGRRFGYEEAHAQQVARLAEIIFDSLAAAYKLTRQQRTLLAAGALLHDIGYHIAHEGHQKHTLYLIKHSELTGFSESEREVIANIARYHRGTPPRERHPDYAALGTADRASVNRLSAILRIADALDRSHDSRVMDVTCELIGATVRLVLHSAQACEQELWAVEQKRDLFEQEFACQLVVRKG